MTTLADPDVDLEAIQHLDFDPTLTCETVVDGVQCLTEAAWFITYRCHCRRDRVWYAAVCEERFAQVLARRKFNCVVCNAKFMLKAFLLRTERLR